MCFLSLNSNIFNYFTDIKNLINKEFPEDIIKEQEEEQRDYHNIIGNDFYIKLRKNRENISSSYVIKKVLIGDVLEFVYFYKSTSLIFSGICIALKKKSFKMPDVSLIIRNIVVKTGVEVVLSYFYNRVYNFNFLDYKRKFYTFNKNKLYFIRDRLNRESRI